MIYELWSIGDVSCPPAVDEEGNVYVVKGIPIPDDETYRGAYPDYLPYPGYMVPSGVVEAYYPNGSLNWREDIGEPARRPVIDPCISRRRQTLPLYNDGLLYVPLSNGVAALGRNGSILWERQFNSSVMPYDKMPFDTEGNIYLADDVSGYHTVYPPGDTSKYFHDYHPPTNRKIYAIGPDGTYTSINESHKGLLPVAASDGIAYYVTSALYDPDRSSLDDLLTWTITAVDLNKGDTLWSCHLDPGKASQAMVNESNIGWIFYDNTTQVKAKGVLRLAPHGMARPVATAKGLRGRYTNRGAAPRQYHLYQLL